MPTIEVKLNTRQTNRIIAAVEAFTAAVENLGRQVDDLGDRVMFVQPKPKKKAAAAEVGDPFPAPEAATTSAAK